MYETLTHPTLYRSFWNRSAAPSGNLKETTQENVHVMKPLHLAIFGPNLSASSVPETVQSACALLRSLGQHGHRLTFYQPDLFSRRTVWECGDANGLRTVSYPIQGYVGLFECLEEASGADVLIKVSGAGTFDGLLELAVLEVRKPDGIAVYLDLDAHATLDRVRRERSDALLTLIQNYDLVLTGGGIPIASAFLALGARECLLLGSTVQPETGRLLPPESRHPGPAKPASGPLLEAQLQALERVFGQCAAQRREPAVLVSGAV